MIWMKGIFGVEKRCFVKSGSMALFIAAFIIKSFVAWPLLQSAMTVLAGIIFCLGIRDVKPLNRNMIIVLLASSGLLAWISDNRLDFGRAVIENAGIVTLLLTSPLLGSILCFAPYESAIVVLANRFVRTDYAFYVVTAGLAALLCSLMTLAAIPFANQLVKPIAGRHAGVLPFSLSRGFVCNLFWSPNLITVAVVLKYVDVSWRQLMNFGIGFSVLAFVICCVIGKYDLPVSRREPGLADAADLRPAKSNLNWYESSLLLWLLVQLIAILGSITLLTQYAKINIYAAVAVIGLSMPMVFALIMKKGRLLRQSLHRYFRETLPNMTNEFMLFTSIGFFSYTLAQSPVIVFVQSRLNSVSGLSPSIIVFMIIMTVAGLSLVGIHPIVTISSLAIVLSQVNIGLSEVQLAISLITGYIMYLLWSPFSTMVMLLSSLFGRSVYAMGIGLNWRFGLALTLTVVAVIHGWRQL